MTPTKQQLIKALDNFAKGNKNTVTHTARLKALAAGIPPARLPMDRTTGVIERALPWSRVDGFHPKALPIIQEYLGVDDSTDPWGLMLPLLTELQLFCLKATIEHPRETHRVRGIKSYANVLKLLAEGRGLIIRDKGRKKVSYTPAPGVPEAWVVFAREHPERVAEAERVAAQSIEGYKVQRRANFGLGDLSVANKRFLPWLNTTESGYVWQLGREAQSAGEFNRRVDDYFQRIFPHEEAA